MADRSDSFVQAANEYFDALVKSRFIEMFGNPISNPLKWPTRTLKEVAPPKQYSLSPKEEGNWLLNLDAVQSNTGAILFKNKVLADQVRGGSIITFSELNVLYSKLRPYLNKVVLPDEPGFGTSELVPLLPNASILTREYLAWMLRSDSFVSMISNAVAGAKMPRVTMDTFWKFNVPLPPTELQNQFADFVRQVDKSKLMFQQLVSRYDELVKSRFIEMFGNCHTSKELGDLATYVNGYAFKPTQWGSVGLPIIRIQNLSGTNSEFNYYNGEIDQKYEVHAGDILISWSATLGVFEWNGPDAYLNQHIFKVYFNKVELDKDFFKYCVSQALRLSESKMHGSTMTHLTKKTFDNIDIVFPDLDSQQKFGSFIRQVDKSKSEILEGIRRLKVPQNS